MQRPALQHHIQSFDVLSDAKAKRRKYLKHYGSLSALTNRNSTILTVGALRTSSLYL